MVLCCPQMCSPRCRWHIGNHLCPSSRRIWQTWVLLRGQRSREEVHCEISAVHVLNSVCYEFQWHSLTCWGEDIINKYEDCFLCAQLDPFPNHIHKLPYRQVRRYKIPVRLSIRHQQERNANRETYNLTRWSWSNNGHGEMKQKKKQLQILVFEPSTD